MQKSQPKYSLDNIQELFDDSVKYFLTNIKGRCYRVDIDDPENKSNCMYYSSVTNNRCIVGHLINADSSNVFEGLSIDNLYTSIVQLNAGNTKLEYNNTDKYKKQLIELTSIFEFNPIVFELLDKLQRFHDNFYGVINIIQYEKSNYYIAEGNIDKLRQLGFSFNLSLDVFNNLTGNIEHNRFVLGMDKGEIKI